MGDTAAVGPVLVITDSSGHLIAQRVDSMAQVLALGVALEACLPPGRLADYTWQVEPRTTLRDAGEAA